MDYKIKTINDSVRVFFIRDHIKDAFPPAFEIYLSNISSNEVLREILIDSSSSYDGQKGGASSKKFMELEHQNSISIDKSDVYELDMIIQYKISFIFKNKRYLVWLNIKGTPNGEEKSIVGTNLVGTDLDYWVKEIENNEV